MYYIYEIDNSKLVDFFDFIFSKCIKVSFKRSYQRGLIENIEPNEENLEKYSEIGYMERSIFDKVQEDMKKGIKKDLNIRHDCEGDYYQLKEEHIKEYEEELEQISWDIDYDKKIKNSKDISFKGHNIDYLGNEITRHSYDSLGGFEELCYFKIGDDIKKIINQLDDLFDWKKFIICNEQFYDFACWRNDNKVIFYTMPSDKCAILNLLPEEYDELFILNLGIKLGK